MPANWSCSASSRSSLDSLNIFEPDGVEGFDSLFDGLPDGLEGLELFGPGFFFAAGAVDSLDFIIDPLLFRFQFVEGQVFQHDASE